MKVKFILETGYIDNKSDILLITGIAIKNNYPLYKDFNFKQSIGAVNVSKENGLLIGEGDIQPEYFNLYPVIGIKRIKTQRSDKIDIVEQSELLAVSLCTAPNFNPNIKTIAEQIK